MPFQKGHQYGKGARESKRDQWQRFNDWMLEAGLTRFRAELDGLHGRAYVKTFTELMEYFKPKYSRQELELSGGNFNIILAPNLQGQAPIVLTAPTGEVLDVSPKAEEIPMPSPQSEGEVKS